MMLRNLAVRGLCAILTLALTAAAQAAPSTDGAGDAAGMRWPADQALPTLPAARHFDVADLSGRAVDAKVMFATLQGLVNRREPRVFFVQAGGEGKNAWTGTLGVPTSSVADPWDLLARYRSEIKGIVVDDPSVPASINVATTLAGLDDGIVVSPRLLDQVKEQSNLPILTDLRGRFHDDLDAYTWEVDNLWPRATHRMLVGMGPNDPSFRDYAVANRALVMWLRVGVPEERALFTRLLDGMPANSPYLGWFQRDRGSGEVEGVTFLSAHGDYNVATDLFWNMSAFGGTRAPDLNRVVAAPLPPLENRIYVTFTLSDGDNMQFDEHRMRVMWNDPARGAVPLNWTVNPILADAAPGMFGYYRRTATQNDDLVAGPSGAGYAFVAMFPDDAFTLFARQTGHYFRRTGIRVAELHDMVRGVATMVSDQKAAIFAREAQPLGVESFIGRVRPGPVNVGGVLPTSVKINVHDVAQARELLANWEQGWDRQRPAFVSVYFDAWHMGPADASALASALGSEYKVVTADELFQLAREAGAFGRD